MFWRRTTGLMSCFLWEREKLFFEMLQKNRNQDINLFQTHHLFLKMRILELVMRRHLSPIAAIFGAHYLQNHPELCQNLLTRSLRHIRASASNNSRRVSDPNTQALWESINIWLDGESNTRFSFLTTGSVGPWLCRPDLQLQHKSSIVMYF